MVFLGTINPPRTHPCVSCRLRGSGSDAVRTSVVVW